MKNDAFSVDVIMRILDVLSNDGNTKRTTLAGKSGLNYAALIRYIKFLRTLRWVEFTSDSDNLISITTIGRSFRKLLQHEGPEDISEEVLEKLMAQSQNNPSNMEASSGGNPSCVFCGKLIKKRTITKEIEGRKYSFDKSECAALFLKFRDVYGKEFMT